MEITVIPEKKFNSVKSLDQLKIRITFIAAAKTKQEKQHLRRLWEQLEESDDIKDLLQIIETMEKEKDSPPVTVAP